MSKRPTTSSPASSSIAIRSQDLFEQRKRYQVLADAGGAARLRAHEPGTTRSVAVWHDGKPQALELDQPLTQYDPNRCRAWSSRTAPRGSRSRSIRSTPMRSRARRPTPSTSMSSTSGTDGKALRKARVLATGVRSPLRRDGRPVLVARALARLRSRRQSADVLHDQLKRSDLVARTLAWLRSRRQVANDLQAHRI